MRFLFALASWAPPAWTMTTWSTTPSPVGLGFRSYCEKSTEGSASRTASATNR